MALDLSGLTQDQQIARAAAYAGVPESVVRGQWRVESGSGTAKADPDGVIRSSAGAEGHFQVMPATRATFEKRNGRTYDMRSFEDGLALYADVMRENMQMAKGDIMTALRIYQGGPNRRGWGKYNAAYAPAVLQGTDVASTPQTGASTSPINPPSMLAAWNGGGGGFLNFNHKGADIPAAWRGDPINSGVSDLAKATKQHIGKVREALGELTMAAAVTQGLPAEQGVAGAMAVRASDTVAPEFARQDVQTADAESNERNVAATYAAGQADRDEAEFREGLTLLDKWGAAFDAGIGAAVANQAAREFEPVAEGWTYNPEEWELSHYTPSELEDIRDAAWSPNELAYTRDRIETRRYSMRVKDNQSGWAGFTYDLVAGFTDPGNWATGWTASAIARGAGVGSAVLFQQGRVGAGIASTAVENAGAAALTNTTLAAMGENRTVGQWLTDAAFSATLGVGFNLGQAKAGAAARDKAILDLATENAQAFGAEWNAELRAKAEAELGDVSPVVLNERVHQLARDEVLDWMRAGMADVPDNFRLFARPDMPEDAGTPSNVAEAGPKASDRENITDGKFTDDVGSATDWSKDPLLARAWKLGGVRGSLEPVIRYLESSKNIPEDYRAIINALKRGGRLDTVRIEPDSVLDSWFSNLPPSERRLVAGGYNPNTDSMALRSGSGYNPEVVVHEIVHAATVKEYYSNAEFKGELDSLLAHINSQLPNVDKSMLTDGMVWRVEQGRTGFAGNARELITYGLTNRDVQAVLRNIPAPDGSRPSAWEWLKDKIARVFGLSGKESSLERLMSIVGDNLGAEIKAPNAAAREARGKLAASIFKNNRERKAFAARAGLDTKISDNATRIQVAEVLARAERFSSQYGIDAAKLQTVMQRVGLEATSTTLMSSQSPVARMIAITLLENPEGAAGRHSTAAIDRKGRFESYMGVRPRQWEAAYRLWRSEVRKAGPIKDFASGWKMRQDFEYEVKLYREQTYMGSQPSSGVHKSIVQMAKSLDEGYNRMAAEQRAVGTVGSSRLPTEDVAGYETRTWLGGKIAAATGARRDSIRQALKEQFDGIGEMYGDEFLEKFSIKYLERIEERAAGMHRRPDNLFSDDKSDTLRDTLRALSMNEEDIAKVMGRYSRGGAKHTKSRIDLDVTQKYRDAEGEFRLMDYLDNRVMDNYRRYAGRVSGDVALAKFGVMGDAGIDVLRKAMQVTGANDVELRAFDQVMSEFTGRVIGTGDPTILANARLLTTAIQLGGAGINQAAEYSNGLPAVGAAGVAQAIGIAPRMRKEILRMLKGEDSGNNILSGFEFISGRGFGLAGYDLHMFNGLDTQATLYGSERAGFITALSQRAANANRILSGQRAVLAVQQRGFAEVLIAKGVKFLRDGTEADTALKDMGINDALLARLRNTQDQVVRWGADGKLEAVDPRALTELKDRQAWLAFYQAIERGTSQILQDTFIGETGKWAHNGWLKLLFQHRTFSLVAQQKQLGRYVGLYGAWGTAGIIAGAMAVAAPLQALRVASRVALMNDEDREEAIEQNIMSPLALGKATMNYVSSVGLLNDVADVGTGVAGGWYEYATDTGAPDWVRKLAGGQLGNRKEIVGGQLAPALGVVNSAAQAIQGRPENLGELLPYGRLPYVIPLLKGAESHME